MRIGDVRRLAFDIEPVSPSWDRRSPGELGPWAQLAIWAADQNFCRNWFPATRSVNEGVYVPLAPIADWLVRYARYIAYEESARAFPTDVDLMVALQSWKDSAPAASFDGDSWDDRRFEWSNGHFLHAGAEGSWLPNLAFVRSDENLWISAAPARFASPGAPEFLFQAGIFAVPWREAKQALSDFVDSVGSSLLESGLADSFPWSRGRGAFENQLEIGLLDQLALELDLSRSGVETLFGVTSESGLRTRLLLPQQATSKDSAAVQAIRDLDLEEGVVRVVVDCDCTTRSQKKGQFRRRRLRALEVASGGRPEREGYQAAELIRGDLGLNGQPLKNLDDFLMDHFDIEIDDLSGPESTHNHAAIGGHLDGFGKVLLFSSPQTRKPWARNMEIFRGVGHLLLDGGPESPAVGAGSSNRAIGPRRRRSGAFAAEMLLPQSAIRERSGGVLDAAAEPSVFEGLMEDYQVGAQTAAWQCWNAGLLSSREVVSDLIGAYGSYGAGAGSPRLGGND